MTYETLLQAVKIIIAAQLKAAEDDGGYSSPAVMMLFHSKSYLMKQADTMMRGEAGGY